MEDYSTKQEEPQNELTREGKRLWLIEHGHLCEIDGTDYLTSKAVARLGGDTVNAEEIADAVKENNGDRLFSAIATLRDGAAFMRDIHGTDDTVEILYASFSVEEACRS